MSKYAVQQHISMKRIVSVQLTKYLEHMLHTVTTLHTVSAYTVSLANNSSTLLVMNTLL